MCTVTYIPTNEGFVLTSSRDEKKQRLTFSPKAYIHDGKTLIYPKDEIAGGTWIASNTNSRIACLLNGAFEKHEPKKSYRKSRGLILLESFTYDRIADFITKINLLDIEPFTLLLIDLIPTFNFTEIRWDGIKKHVTHIQKHESKIWSSATLYDKNIRSEREKWFREWIVFYQTSHDKNIFTFHNQKHSDSIGNDIIMARENGLQTVSVTQIKYTDNNLLFSYTDLINNINTTLLNGQLI